MVVESVASSVHWMVTMGKGGRSDGGACCRRGGGSTRCFEDFAPAASAGSGTGSPRTVGSGNREPVVWLSGRGWFDRLTRDAGCGTRLIGAPGFPPATSSGQALRGRRDDVWLLGSGGEPGSEMAGAGIDVFASTAISAGNAGRDGGPGTLGCCWPGASGAWVAETSGRLCTRCIRIQSTWLMGAGEEQ